MSDPAGATGSTSAELEVAAEIPFQDFCGLLERIFKVKGTDRKKKLFGEFLKQWREAHAKLHPSDANETKDTFLPIMRLLLPQLDKIRPAYGMKETVLAKYYIEILNIAKESIDAKKLLNYRAPASAKQQAGDFADVAYFILRNRCPDSGKLTVSQVNGYLDDLAMSYAKKDRPEMKKALQLLLRNTSALEQKWLIRIILKEMKTGLSENSVFSVFHPGASDLFNVCNSLEKVCVDLRDPSIHLNEASIGYFTPFRPMLGERAAIDQVVKLMDHNTFYIETKFDGDRMQMHKQGNQYRYYSRSSKDYTSTFGASEYEGSFSPKIHCTFNSKVKSCILDGEMVGWDSSLEVFLPKGDNVDVKAITESTVGVQQCFVVFDVLKINDDNLANCPLIERAEKLKEVFEPTKGVIHIVDREEVNTKKEVVDALNKAIDNREEGLLVKKPTSIYQPDKRKGSGWLKLKPEYVDSLSDQLDLVIVGGYYGVGRRAGMVSHFMCAVAVPPEVDGDHPSVFHSFCKVGSGYTLSELKDLGIKLQPHWKKFNTKHPPQCLILASGFKEKPDLWIDPRDSQIVQIKAAEIIVSDKYKCGCTLRFPRVEKVRDDKEWYDCMNLDELEQMKQIASGKLFHMHLDDDTDQPAPKKRKVASTIERPRGVAAQFRQTDVSGVHEVSKMFKGKEFCVINGTRGLSKEEAEKRIAEHGGSFVQNPGGDTFCVLVHKLIVRANNIISTGDYDVVKIEWLMKCLEEKQCLPFNPSLMIHASPRTIAIFSELYDKFGDSFTEDSTADNIVDIFQKMDDKCSSENPITVEEIALMEERYFSEESDRGFFRNLKFILDKYTEIGNIQSAIPSSTLELTELDVRLHGGSIAQDIDETVTHIIFDKDDLERIPLFRQLERQHARKHHFVTSDWVSDSIECKFTKNERLYEPKS